MSRITSAASRAGGRLFRSAGVVPWSGLVVCTWAFLHSLVWLVCATALTFEQFRAFWTGPGVFGATVLQASAATTAGLGALLVVEVWGEVTQRTEGRARRLAAHAVSLLLVGSLVLYFRSVEAVVQWMGGSR